MNWRGAGNTKDYSNSAMIQIISTLLVLLIVSGSVGSIVVFGVTTIDDKNEENETSSVKKYFSEFSTTVSESVGKRIGDKTSIKLPSSNGEILMDNNNYDRTIITYSTCSDYGFNISGLNDKVYEFEINLDNNYNNPYATISDIKNEGNIEYLITCNIENNIISSNLLLEGNKLIELYSYSYMNSEDPFGKIWLFDSNYLEYSSSKDNYNMIIEKASLLIEEAGNIKIKNSPLVNIYDSSIAIHICQTFTDDIISVASSTHFQNIYLTNNGSSVKEAGYVYNLRFQFYNGHAQSWYDYYNNTIDKDNTLFYEDPTGSLLYLPSASQDGIWLTMMHSIVDFELV